MSAIICVSCRHVFDTDDDPDCWCGPDLDLPVCQTCRDEEASYASQAHPVNRLTGRVMDDKDIIR